jgi:hypothetical protein
LRFDAVLGLDVVPNLGVVEPGSTTVLLDDDDLVLLDRLLLRQRDPLHLRNHVRPRPLVFEPHRELLGTEDNVGEAGHCAAVGEEVASEFLIRLSGDYAVELFCVPTALHPAPLEAGLMVDVVVVGPDEVEVAKETEGGEEVVTEGMAEVVRLRKG